jgi:hypothetical protein
MKWWVLLVILVFCAARSVRQKDKVNFAIDYHPSLNPSPSLRLVHMLFNVHLLHNATDIRNNTDILAYANYTALTNMYEESGVRIPTYVENPLSLMAMFDSKAAWKAWMVQIGLGSYIPHALDTNRKPEEHRYPIVLKTNAHFGRGVFVLHSAEDLRNVSTTLRAENQSYLLEEALTGLGLSEVTMWGSAYRGRLLSLRCVRQVYSQDDLLHSAFKNSSVAQPAVTTAGRKVPFVRGFQAKAVYDRWLPCGRDIVSVISDMMASAGYTGSFCSAFKWDYKKRAKLLEVNARYCGTLVNNDALFLAAFVPLAGAIAAAMPESKLNYTLTHGALHNTYRMMIEEEEKVLRTGGGWYGGKWVATETFDPALRLDHVYERFVQILRHHH